MKFVEYYRHWVAILGAIKGTILVLVVTCLLLVIAPSTHAMIRESVTGAVTNQAIQQAALMLPEKLATALQKAMNSRETPELTLPIDESFQFPR